MELELPATVNLFYGPSPHDAVGRLTQRFGRPRVPPAFAFAPWNDAIFGSGKRTRAISRVRPARGRSAVECDLDGGLARRDPILQETATR